MKTETRFIKSENDLDSHAAELLSLWKNRKKFAFYGDLAAGKTTFIRSVCNALGVVDEVSSPTFALINVYQSSSGEIVHADLYRIESLEEALDTGIEDYLYNEAYCFIEWPEIIEELLPEDTVRIRIEALNESERKLQISTQ
jgi:tRNA threonylcarbamoyladenosine biosynthesis protein TsaE